MTTVPTVVAEKNCCGGRGCRVEAVASIVRP
jgi:hypothetical protein